MMESVLDFIILKFILWIFPSRKIEDVSDAAWATRERDFASQKMSYDLEHRKWVTVNKNCLAVIQSTNQASNPIITCIQIGFY